MIDCPVCGHRVSEKAKACPNCGHPINPDPPPQVKFEPAKSVGVGFWGIVGAVILALIILSLF